MKVDILMLLLLVGQGRGASPDGQVRHQGMGLRRHHQHQSRIQAPRDHHTTTSTKDQPDGPLEKGWRDITMPEKSFFLGFEAPTNESKWKECVSKAESGEQVLLSKALAALRTPMDIPQGDREFRWIHRISEVFRSKNTNWLFDLPEQSTTSKAPIVMLGYRKFQHAGAEGPQLLFETMGPQEIINNRDFKVSRKIVAVGNMDENWGWLSTYFLNRTVPWGKNFGGPDNPFDKNYQYSVDQMARFLDEPNIVMLLVNQHHNFTHPKVISVPLGVTDSKIVFQAMIKAQQTSQRKDNLLFSAGSNYGFRPAIRSCILEHLGGSFVVSKKIHRNDFLSRLISSCAVLCMPGLGYDTYRLWETLAAGSMPVVERAMGLDRTLYRLPVLMLDDYFDLTEKILRTAYVEALYRADEWEYERMTRQWWERLLYEVSESGSDEALQRLHPMSAVDVTFTRPLVPFDCYERPSGCGAGTKRVPRRSCAIDPALLSKDYKWDWNHHSDTRRLVEGLMNWNTISEYNDEDEWTALEWSPT